MRSADVSQSEIFSYRTLEQRIPVFHPLRKLRIRGHKPGQNPVSRRHKGLEMFDLGLSEFSCRRHRRKIQQPVKRVDAGDIYVIPADHLLHARTTR